MRDAAFFMLGFVLSVASFSFLRVSVRTSDLGGRKRVWEYIAEAAGLLLDVWSMSFLFLLGGVFGLGLMGWSLLHLAGVL